MRALTYSCIAILLLLVIDARASSFLPSEGNGPAPLVQMLLTRMGTQSRIVIDDMVFDAEQLGRNGFQGLRWPAGVVHYAFDADVTSEHQDQWRAAASEWSNTTIIRFYPRTTESEYILVHMSDSSNASEVGMQLGSATDMWIVNWDHPFIVAHEIAHALGAIHEQSRPDRDSFIQINWSNICQDCCQGQSCNPNFEIVEGSQVYGEYDFDSVMHYSQCAFALDCQDGINPTITVLPPNQGQQTLIGQQDHLSALDISGMQARYECDDAVRPTLTSPPDLATGQPLSGTLDWEDIPGAQGYRYHVGDLCSYGQQVETTVSQGSYSVLHQERTYYWQVKVKDACGVWRSYSDCFSFTTAPPSAPSTPTGLVAVAGSGYVSLGWNENPSSENVRYYRVYRGSTQPYPLLATVTAPVHSYVDNQVANGTTYCYELTAVNATGQEGGRTPPACATPQVPTCQVSLSSPSVTPGSGNPSTNFWMSVVYHDLDGLPPDKINAVITPSGGSAFRQPLTRRDTTPFTVGSEYAGPRAFAQGNYCVYFEANNGTCLTDVTTLPPICISVGPPTPGQLYISCLSAAPTFFSPNGDGLQDNLQATYCLAGAGCCRHGQLQLRDLNGSDVGGPLYTWGWANMGTYQVTLTPAPPDGTYDLWASAANFGVGLQTYGGVSQGIDVALAPNGDICVFVWPSGSSGRIDVYNSNVSYVRTFGEGLLSYPAGIHVDTSGNVFVAEAGESRITKLSSSGSVLMRFSTGSQTYPEDVITDSSGNIYVIDILGLRILKFSAGGTYLGASPFALNTGNWTDWYRLASDTAGRMYVGTRDRVIRFNTSLALEREYPMSDYAGVEVPNPASAVAIDLQGNLIVASSSGSVFHALKLDAATGALIDSYYGYECWQAGSIHFSDTNGMIVLPSMNPSYPGEILTAFGTSSVGVMRRFANSNPALKAGASLVCDSTRPSTVIAAPTNGAAVCDLVAVTGTASDMNLSSYSLYYRPDGQSQRTLISSSVVPVTNGLLGTWNTNGLSSGSYYIILTGLDKAANQNADSVLVSVCPPLTASCCAPSGACAVTTEGGCVFPGVWHQEWPTCAPVNYCPEPTASCCVADGSCTVTTQTACVSPNVWHPEWLTCAPVNYCPQLTASCCAPSGVCTVTTEAACAPPSVWHLEWPSCSPVNNCAPPTASCCAPSGSCTVTTQAACVSPNVWHPEWLSCDPNQCPPLGACCDGFTGGCTLTLQGNCALPSTWHAGWTSCDPNPCPPPSGGSVFNALTEYGGTQGGTSGVWFYEYAEGGVYHPMEYVHAAPCWEGEGPWVAEDGMAWTGPLYQGYWCLPGIAKPNVGAWLVGHPGRIGGGADYDAVLKWVAPRTSVIRVQAQFRGIGPDGGDGIDVVLLKGDQAVEIFTIAASDTSVHSFDRTLPVMLSDVVRLALRARSENYNDLCAFDMTVEILADSYDALSEYGAIPGGTSGAWFYEYAEGGIYHPMEYVQATPCWEGEGPWVAEDGMAWTGPFYQGFWCLPGITRPNIGTWLVGHPGRIGGGADYDAVLKWVAPRASVVNVRVQFRGVGPDGGDGIDVVLIKQEQALESFTIAPSDTSVHSFDRDIPVVPGDAVRLSLRARSENGYDLCAFNMTIGDVDITGLHDDAEDIGGTSEPQSAMSFTVVPNPFGATTEITMNTPLRSLNGTQVQIFDLRGRLMRTIQSAGFANEGRRVIWDGRDDRHQKVPKGLYVIRVRAGEHTASGKVVVMN